MPARRAAVLALVALMAAGCTSVEGDPSPAPTTFTELLGTADLDAVAPAGVDVLDLAAGPDGPLVLLADSADPSITYLAPVGEDGVGGVQRLDGPGEQLFVGPDGAVLVLGPGRLTTVGGGTVELAVDGETAALSPDGRRLYVVAEGRLAAVDPATGEVQATTDLEPGLTVKTLAAGPDGPVALMSDARALDLADVAVLGTWADDLGRAELAELASDRPASIPSALRLTDDGDAVVTLTVHGDDPFRVTVVEDGEVTAAHPIPGTDRAPADLALSPDGRVAYLAVAGFEVESGVVTLDLSSGEQLAAGRLCEGQGTFGRVALTDDRLTVIGACVGRDNSSTTAFVLG
ncbi:hypothetical protein ACI8AA_22205 [Geodermatophilus sp. SYSU D01180]